MTNKVDQFALFVDAEQLEDIERGTRDAQRLSC